MKNANVYSRNSLLVKLNRFSKNNYKLYKGLKGTYDFGEYSLTFDHIQGDPFASPSKITITIPLKLTGYPANLMSTTDKSIAFRDALARVIAKNIRKLTKGNRGTGNSGVFAINYGGQTVIDRNSIVINGEYLKVRLLIGLPAFGRTIAASQAQEMLFDELPQLVDQSLYWKRQDSKYFNGWVNLMEKQQFIRRQLPRMGLIAFIADGAILPRRSGVENTPLTGAVEFRSPPSLSVSIKFPDGSTIIGMGIPRGITLITGGGFHGKSTLLNAIQAGIYNHIAGDGREYVISDPNLVKIRAEDGRFVAGTDISPFINNLPGGKSTLNFYTENASGSTSQAANIMEALEVGTTGLLMDEDTSATNFLIRDKRMRELISADKEPITPFIDVARALFDQHQISTILVSGGSGDYIDIADRVLVMENYRVIDATERARKIANIYPYTHIGEFQNTIRTPIRIIEKDSFNPAKGKREAKISAINHGILFGRQQIDLKSWEQIIDFTQYSTIGDAIYYCVKKGYFDSNNSLKTVLNLFERDIQQQGLDCIFQTCYSEWNYYTQIRKLDIMAAINRLRTLIVRHSKV